MLILWSISLHQRSILNWCLTRNYSHWRSSTFIRLLLNCNIGNGSLVLILNWIVGRGLSNVSVLIVGIFRNILRSFLIVHWILILILFLILIWFLLNWIWFLLCCLSLIICVFCNILWSCLIVLRILIFLLLLICFLTLHSILFYFISIVKIKIIIQI